MRILFLTPYPHGKAPSQRFRFEHFFDRLRAAGIDIHVQSFIDEETWSILYRSGHHLAKVVGVLRGFLRRCAMLARARRYDAVFVHREASPLGPPVFEFLLARVLRVPLIFDFDDAIWLPNTSSGNRWIAGLKWHGKTASICRWAHRISAGNDHLAEYARRFNQRVTVVPTVVDTEARHDRLQDQDVERPAIGWTGSHSTMHYLDELVAVLRRLRQRFDFETIVISDKPPAFELEGLRFIPWNKDSEIDDLLRFHIGVMPLRDDVWARGKCGFKAIQYMALGIVPVVSPVGVNSVLVADGTTGMLADDEWAWEAALADLLTDHARRATMGRAARTRIVEAYSVTATWPVFASLFDDVSVRSQAGRDRRSMTRGR